MKKDGSFLSRRVLRALMLFVGMLAVFGFLGIERVSREHVTFEELRRDIGVSVRTDGPKSVLKGITDATQHQDISYDECHVLMHLAGHETYSYFSGVIEEALKISDGVECLGGFVHGLEAEIVLTNDEPIEQLHRLCLFSKELGVNNGPCYHGAGHANLELTQDIFKSLSFCDALVGDVEQNLSGCYRGVFSELNNIIIGFDGNSGILKEGTSYRGVERNNPYLFCRTLDTKYQEGCYTQSTMLLMSTDIEESLRKCVQNGYRKDEEETCVHIMTAVNSRAVLSLDDFYIAPKILHTLPHYLQRASVRGVRETYGGFLSGSYDKKWQPFCESFTDEDIQSFCYTNQ